MIISCGDSLIDMIPRTLDTGETAFLPICGGALFNTAIALGRLNQNTGLLTGISTDMFGEQLLQALDNSNVNTDYCIRTNRPTTMAFVKLLNGNASYHFVDENSAQRMLQKYDLLDLPDVISTLHFGCLSLVSEPCATFFETCMQKYAPHKIISLDPNIRPSFITDENTYRKRLLRLLNISDIIKVSDEDFAWLYSNESFDNFAKMHIQKNCSLVILTQASNPIRIFYQGGSFSIPVPPVQVVDTVGAGDTFNAGVLASLSQQNLLSKNALKQATQDQITTAINLGITVARYTVQQAGAVSPFLHQIS